MKIIKRTIAFLLIFALGFFSYGMFTKIWHQNKVLKQVISRLAADSRAADVLVTGVNYDEKTGKNSTTIKFLEYDVEGNPLEPRYFTFSGNIIQFQSLVIRFSDDLVMRGDRMKGKSVYLFWKVFMLDGENTKEYDITEVDTVPRGYKVSEGKDAFESELWEKFWSYALDEDERGKIGIKSAQIEAPGTMFVPGVLYTLKIEHDGGIRIDSEKLPPILMGEINSKK